MAMLKRLKAYFNEWKDAIKKKMHEREIRCTAAGCGRAIERGGMYLEAEVCGMRRVFCSRSCLDSSVRRIAREYGFINIHNKKRPE